MIDRPTITYNSAYHLPRIYDYAHADELVTKTKPIRGRSPVLIPLGRRKDADMFCIRKQANGDIECVLYKTPVVTFRADGTARLYPENWVSAMTVGFMARTTGLRVWLSRRKIGVQLNGSEGVEPQKVAIRAGTELILNVGDRSTNYALTVHTALPVYTYVISRKGANNVRARYSEFTSYLKGFLSLRNTSSNPKATSVLMSEVADVLGLDEYSDKIWSMSVGNTTATQMWKPDFKNIRLLNDKPQGKNCLSTVRTSIGENLHKEAKWFSYQVQCLKFLSLCTSDQPQGAKADNFYAAAITLLGHALMYGYFWPKKGEDMTVELGVPRVLNTFTQIVGKYHSDEMLAKVLVKPNMLPNDKYDAWVTKLPVADSDSLVSA